MKDCLAGTGDGMQMNSSLTNRGGWKSCKMRTFCNTEFKDAIPSTLLPIFKQFPAVSSNGESSSTVSSDDYFALFAEKEILGTNQCANATAEASLFHIEWYKTPANLNKGPNYWGWWTRSPSIYVRDEMEVRNGFCTNSGATQATGYNDVSPFGCI